MISQHKNGGNSGDFVQRGITVLGDMVIMHACTAANGKVGYYTSTYKTNLHSLYPYHSFGLVLPSRIT